MMPISMFQTHVAEGAIDRVTDTLRSSHLSEGEQVRRFEEELEGTLGLRNPVAVNSGTAALHMALILAGVEAGDEVIIPAQTFVATGLAVLMQRAIPVFADIQYKTGNVEPTSIRQKVTEKTKAILPVHWAGYPCDMEEILAIGREFGVPVIEDAAHALGAKYRGAAIGVLSDYTCLSFQAIKHLTTGDGGAVCISDSTKLPEALRRRWFGIDRHGSRQSLLGERQYDIKELGFKYHMNDFAASLGLANMVGVLNRIMRHQAICRMYRKDLADVPGIDLFESLPDRESACWIFGMHVEKRADFVRALASSGISASVVHQRIDRNQVFGGIRDDLVNQELFDASQIHIPCHAGLSDEQVSETIRTIQKGW